MLRRAIVAVAVLAAVLFAADPTIAHTIRGHSTHGRSRVFVHGGTRVGFFASYYYLPYYYPYGYYYYPPYPAYYGQAYLPDVAYLDTDISPEEAEVYLDGEYVGIADDYDGFPGYLPLKLGRHTVAFKVEGHKTVIRRIKVPRGAVLDLEFTLPKGSGTEGPSERKEQGEDEEISVPEYVPPGGGAEGDDAREEDPSAPGFVRLNVSPADASVYIDGKFYGTASRLSRLHGDLRLESGTHRIEVVRPGYRSMAREVKISPGESVSLDLSLDRNSGTEPPPR